MTQQDGAPLTRRALRTQAAAGTPAATPQVAGTPSATPDGTPAPRAARPLTRRELRLADAGLLHVPSRAAAPATPLPPARTAPRPTDAHGATPADAGATPVPSDRPAPGPVTAGPTPTERPLTRRELRLRERGLTTGDQPAGAVTNGTPGPAAAGAPPTGDVRSAADAVTPAEAATACRPPFIASLVLPAEHPALPDTPSGDADGGRPAQAAARVTHVAPGGTGAAHRGSTGPATRRAGRSPATGGPVPSSRRLLGHVARKPVAVVALSAGLLTVGVTQVHAEQGIVAQARAAAETARTALERQERSETAAADRLTAQAAAYAAAQRAQALAAAEAAVAAAHGAKEVAGPVLDAETVSRLEAAAAELAAMLEATPAPPLPTAEAPGDTPDEAGSTAVAEPTGAEAAPTRVDQPSRSVPADGRPALPAEAAASETAAEAPAGQEADAANPAEVAPGPDAPADAGPDDVAGSSDSAVEQAAASAAAAPVQDLVEALPDLDIEVTRRILERAEEVAALTAEVQGLADAKIAEAVAAAAAAEQARLEAEAAAAAAAAELARKVAVAENAGNGDIPADVLCGVAFTSGVQLRCDAAAALEELNAAYRADFGRDLDVVSSYRSYSQQVAVKRTRGGLAAQPGTSNHGRGVAVDFGGFGGLGNFSTANYRWMKANAERFGWYHPRIMQPGGGGPQEPWHWEFGTDS